MHLQIFKVNPTPQSQTQIECGLQKVQMCKDNSRVTCLAENHVVVTVVVVVELVAANLGTVVVAANLVAVVELIADIKH
jgi:hypothetical protein